MSRVFRLVLALSCAACSAARAQAWNDTRATAIVERGAARRRETGSAGLDDFKARAHGFVFFLAQLGDEGLADPPQLVKSDQLELEVYWKAPGASKQRIIGWRDRVDLPTDIAYHRDHLGIVQNGFSDRIRLGEGTEVRDVPHPLAADGLTRYDFAVVDSVTIGLPGRTVRAIEVAFRPKRLDEPGIVGSMFLDAGAGDVVRLRFNFTRSAYLDASIEDITVVLENALWDGRWWLPRRQEIEIRRRSTWLDLPARGIIRGRWEIDGYEFNTGIADRDLRGVEIGAAPAAVRDTFPWAGRLDLAIAEVTGPIALVEMDAVRARVREIVGGRLLTGLPRHGLTASSLSDAAHVNRVEGFAPGIGYVGRLDGGAVTVRGWLGYGISDERLKARLDVDYRVGLAILRLQGAREIRDVGDASIVAPVVNSLAAQEFGRDYGDYVLREGAWASIERGAFHARAGLERLSDVGVRASPVSGAYRLNPPLGSGRWGIVALGARRRTGGVSHGPQTGWTLDVEAGLGEGRGYGRVRGQATIARPLVGRTVVSARIWGGWGSDRTPAHRAFVMGGRGTLVGEPHRAWGGRRAAWAELAWRLPVPFPAIPLGPFASTGDQLIVVPFVAAGWTHSSVGLPWNPTDGIRPVIGIAAEVFHRFVRVEVGWGVRAESIGIVVDLRRDLWPIL
ncbi:MAG TPA: hypothetical protein VGA37_00180 [Gemmatimonadales bacterium]